MRDFGSQFLEVNGPRRAGLFGGLAGLGAAGMVDGVGVAGLSDGLAVGLLTAFLFIVFVLLDNLVRLVRSES